MKDTLCAYYTNSDDITSYMVHKLDIKNDDIILEPSAGEGVFIDQILKENKNVYIDALDINPKALDILLNKYSTQSISIEKTISLSQRINSKTNPKILIKETDTLLDEEIASFALSNGYYSKVIGNPPYGAWQDYSKRDLLKSKYPGQYVKETYSLFLLRCVSALKIGGRLSFIIPDTFLFLNLFEKLREYLLLNTKIDEILIFPSKFFPGVSFGYSNLSIITLEKCEQNQGLNNSFFVIRGFKEPSELKLVINEHPKNLEYLKLKQKNIYSNPQHKVILAKKSDTEFITKSERTLGDVADILTGFYTGDNTKFIKAASKDIKGSKNYDIVDKSLVYHSNNIDGVDAEEAYIPYIKSASSHRYIKNDDDWFVRWDVSTIKFYKTNKKSRFQNSQFYFKKGIGTPMVKSSKTRAFLFDNRVFDQSIVGIFPKDISKINYILALMNSETINQIIRMINPTANNSSNYIKAIPYIEPNKQEFKKINSLVDSILNDKNISDNEIEKINMEISDLIDKIYNHK